VKELDDQGIVLQFTTRTEKIFECFKTSTSGLEDGAVLQPNKKIPDQAEADFWIEL